MGNNSKGDGSYILTILSISYQESNYTFKSYYIWTKILQNAIISSQNLEFIDYIL